MPIAAMTGRERVNRMFQRRDHDRIPRHDTYWAETIQRWQGEGLDGDAGTLLQMLGADFHLMGAGWVKPDLPTHQVAEDEQTITTRDEWGAVLRRWKGRSGTPEHIGFDCDSPEKWRQIYKPALLASAPAFKRSSLVESFRRGRELERWCCLTGLETFEATRRQMGDEITLMAMVTDPQWIVEFSRLYTDKVLESFDAAVAAGVEADGVWIYGDMAFNHATMCSPAMYRELIWPDHKRLADWAHAHGMKFIFHTDGDVNGVMDLYVEAGFDCLQPLEAKADMDVRRLFPRYGERMAFFGNINVMAMGTNDREKIEQEIASKFAAGMAMRGYAYHSDHSVPPTVSWETYRFIMQKVEQYGRYG